MKQPNIIYVFADQWRRQAVGFMEQDEVITPHMDRFAQESAVFTQAVSCTPLCSPHRSSLMTGKYALSTGVYTNCKNGLSVMLSPEETGIGDALKAGGYETGYIGKWHLDLPEQNVEPNPASGAKEWDAYTPPGPKRMGFDYWYSYGTFDEHLTPHYWKDSPEQIQINEWSVAHETDVALAFMEEKRQQDKPFALFLSWNPPHSPFELVPEKYKELYKDKTIEKRANVQIADPFLVHTGETIPGGEEQWERSAKDYFAAISGIDEQFGRLLESLNNWGIAEHTIVVLTSDHGELLGSHGMFAKHSWHEESIGVPFMIRWPERLRAHVCEEVLNTVDIMPTLLDLAGLSIPGTVQGSSAAPLLLNSSRAESIGESTEERAAFISAYPGRLVAIKEFEEAGLNHLAYGWRGIRFKRYSYIIDNGYAPDCKTRRLLYDLQEDPYQLNPLQLEHASEHEIAEQLEQEILKRLKELNDPFKI